MSDKTARCALERTKIALFKTFGLSLVGLSTIIQRKAIEPDAFIQQTFGELLLRHSYSLE